MKIRRDALAVSTILFTLALLLLTPSMLNNARVDYQSRFRDISDYPVPGIAPDQVVIPNYAAPLGIASLAVIGIGLIVTWAGYIKGVRWTWFVMFTITWVWAFPVLMLPYLYPWVGVAAIARSIPAAIRESLQAEPYSGLARAFLKVVLVFLLMVVALVLPIKTFWDRAGGGRPCLKRRHNLTFRDL
ncbi:MAG TPA: hypothetical protein VG204_11240 [Terriglobia bacterium]|nr:hypothetical protein [Terriglobia bacterium]